MRDLIIAQFKFAPVSPRKMGLIAALIRGKSVSDALEMLRFSVKRGAKILRKVVYSAASNAEHNYGADMTELTISQVCIGRALRKKKIHFRGKGRMSPIVKTYSHVLVGLK
jgi:large subunit ribosomal protein L22